jgi:hypothetical protein
MIASCAMWNLTPEYIQQVKEELKGRRAAIQARHADELKSIEADLEEVESLERIAYAVAVKHLPDPLPAETLPEDAAAEMATLQPMVADPENPDPQSEARGLLRWRAHHDMPAASESV